MAVETETTEKITCDNPRCPGPPAELSDEDRHGWLFVTSEVYGQPVSTHVFCSFACAAGAAQVKGEELTAAKAPQVA